MIKIINNYMAKIPFYTVFATLSVNLARIFTFSIFYGLLNILRLYVSITYLMII